MVTQSHSATGRTPVDQTNTKHLKLEGYGKQKPEHHFCRKSWFKLFKSQKNKTIVRIMPHSPLDHLSPHSCLSVGLFLPAYHTDCSNILAILAVLSLSTHFCRLSALSWFNLTYIACGHSLLFHAQHQH